MKLPAIFDPVSKAYTAARLFSLTILKKALTSAERSAATSPGKYALSQSDFKSYDVGNLFGNCKINESHVFSLVAVHFMSGGAQRNLSGRSLFRNSWNF